MMADIYYALVSGSHDADTLTILLFVLLAPAYNTRVIFNILLLIKSVHRMILIDYYVFYNEIFHSLYFMIYFVWCCCCYIIRNVVNGNIFFVGQDRRRYGSTTVVVPLLVIR